MYLVTYIYTKKEKTTNSESGTYNNTKDEINTNDEKTMKGRFNLSHVKRRNELTREMTSISTHTDEINEQRGGAFISCKHVSM